MASIPNWYVIVNPTSGNGSSKRKWPKIKTLLHNQNFQFVYAFTKYNGHSIQLTQDAVSQGFRKFICIGGDGTIHNVVNGIMSQTSVISSAITLGIIPIGTGNDWVKTYGISKNLKTAVEVIKRGTIKTQDVGKIILEDDKSNPVYFNNLAGVGFDAYVVSKVKAYKALGAIAYLAGALLGLFGFTNFIAQVKFNESERSTNALMILIGICQFSGGGMQLTKNADPQDGFFDITITNDFGKSDMIKNIFNLFNGKVTSSSKVETAKTKKIQISIEQGAPYIQADGELIGKGNFEVIIMPKAFSFYA